MGPGRKPSENGDGTIPTGFVKQRINNKSLNKYFYFSRLFTAMGRVRNKVWKTQVLYCHGYGCPNALIAKLKERVHDRGQFRQGPKDPKGLARNIESASAPPILAGQATANSSDCPW
jgi:hypothetical protein